MKVLLVLTALIFVAGCGKDSNPQPQVKHCIGSWSACKGDCGEGKGKQYFVVMQQAENGGQACEAAEGAEQACTSSVCQGSEAEYCKAEGKKFQCGTNEWWNLACGGDPVNEKVYFESTQSISAKAKEKQMSSCVKVTFKDGHQENVHFGFGPCLPCGELGLSQVAKAALEIETKVYQQHFLMNLR